MKRKQSDSALDDDQLPVSTPKRQRTIGPNGYTNGETHHGEGPAQMTTPSKRERVKSTPKKSTAAATTPGTLNPSGLKTPTHKSKAKSLFSTPTKSALVSTPGRVRNADRSAKRKSVRLLLDQDEDEVWDGADRLAEEILEEEEEVQTAVGKQERGDVEVKEIESSRDAADQSEEPVLETIEAQPASGSGLVTTAETPKRRAGRPKGAKNKRSPTPEGELPPHERYFFQNRAGPPRTSNNTLSKVTLLTHEEYFGKLAAYTDPFHAEKEFLLDVHHRSFPQWDFEFAEGFNICLFGYGCKRRLVTQYADWIYQKYNNSTKTSSSPPTIIIVNGHTPNISIRSIFATIATAILGENLPSKLGSQPAEVLELLQSAMKTTPRRRPITILINSIDAPPLRRAASQALLARLAATPMVRLLATADTPNFTLMWDISQRDLFNFVFHDCTTFAAYEPDVLDVVEEVHNLLGRKGRRVGGKDGVGFVLKSLPENARNLYRLLLTELLSALDIGHVSDDEVDGGGGIGAGGGGGGAGGGGGGGGMAHEESGIEFRMLYQKAAEEFIASSEMMFRTLLKEFHDHQMITSRMDSSGMEILGVPLSRVEMEGVLEDLVLS